MVLLWDQHWNTDNVVVPFFELGQKFDTRVLSFLSGGRQEGIMADVGVRNMHALQVGRVLLWPRTGELAVLADRPLSIFLLNVLRWCEKWIGAPALQVRLKHRRFVIAFLPSE